MPKESHVAKRALRTNTEIGMAEYQNITTLIWNKVKSFNDIV